MNATKILTPNSSTCRPPAILSEIPNQTKHITKSLRINSIKNFSRKKPEQLASAFLLEQPMPQVAYITLHLMRVLSAETPT